MKKIMSSGLDYCIRNNLVTALAGPVVGTPQPVTMIVPFRYSLTPREASPQPSTHEDTPTFPSISESQDTRFPHSIS